MERLTTKFNGGYLFNLPPKNDENDLSAHMEYMDKVSIKLGEYEDLEEQGLLLRLPIPIGSRVFVIDSDCRHPMVCLRGECRGCSYHYNFVNTTAFEASMIDNIGKTVFMFPDEAEAALAKMKEGV